MPVLLGTGRTGCGPGPSSGPTNTDFTHNDHPTISLSSEALLATWAAAHTGGIPARALVSDLACMAEMGNDVLCLDLDPEKIRILKEGGIPIHEPGLDAVVARNPARAEKACLVLIDGAAQDIAAVLASRRKLPSLPALPASRRTQSLASACSARCSWRWPPRARWLKSGNCRRRATSCYRSKLRPN